MIDPFKSDSEQSKLILRRFALARAAIVLGVAMASAMVHIACGARIDLSTAQLYAIFSVALVESLIVVLMLRPGSGHSPTMRFSFLLLCADLAVISGIVMLTGGVRSVFAFLYIAVILSASILLSFNWSLIIATISSISFTGVVLLVQYGLVVPATAFIGQGILMRVPDLWAYATMIIFAFYLTAFLAGYLSRRVGLLQSFQQNILNSFSSGFMCVDSDCIVTFLNASASSLLQKPRSKCIGQHVSSVLAVPEGKPNILEEAVRGQKELRGKEITVIRGDGLKIPVGITVSPLRNTSNKHMGSIAAFIDLTELKRMEEMLRRSDRLAAIGEMSASLAHELRNPVASIRGAVQEMAETFRLAGTNAQLMDIVIKESDQLGKIVAGFLNFVGTGRFEKERFDIRPFMDEVILAARRCFVKNGNIQVISECDDELHTVIYDRSQIKEAILNIIQNGIEAMPDGGAIRVKTHRSEKSADHLCISVQDEGGGIPLEARQRIFDPFYTTKSNGTGLGMAIVHRIVASHGGTVEIASEEGQGTTVTLVLPRES